MDYFIQLLGFSIVAAGTPGPNNLMVMASGANYGYWRTLPHLLGITIGYPLMTLALGLGIGTLFARYPVLHTILTILTLVYLAWLAWKVAMAGEPDRNTDIGKPLTFFQAAAFQWVNPKAWALGLAALTLYNIPDTSPLVYSAFIAGMFVIVTFPCISIWCLFGQGIARYLADPLKRRIFNWVMAALLILSVVPILL